MTPLIYLLLLLLVVALVVMIVLYIKKQKNCTDKGGSSCSTASWSSSDKQNAMDKILSTSSLNMVKAFYTQDNLNKYATQIVDYLSKNYAVKDGLFISSLEDNCLPDGDVKDVYLRTAGLTLKFDPSKKFKDWPYEEVKNLIIYYTLDARKRLFSDQTQLQSYVNCICSYIFQTYTYDILSKMKKTPPDVLAQQDACYKSVHATNK